MYSYRAKASFLEKTVNYFSKIITSQFIYKASDMGDIRQPPVNCESTDASTPLKVLIAGGGIGGLSAAIALRQAGHVVEV